MDRQIKGGKELKKEGLLVEPEFYNTDKYLQSGKKTEITEEIRKVCQMIGGQTEEMIIRNIVLWINKNMTRLHSGNDSRKFKRTANEILMSGERTGCCDSSTLFTALARGKGIPTMQIITLNKEWAKKVDKGEKTGTSGHYFSACYLKDISGKSNWILVDSDRMVQDVRDIKLNILNMNSRNIEKNYYAFAYVRDYSDVYLHGLEIDSIKNMAKIQNEAYKICDKNDFICEDENER